MRVSYTFDIVKSKKAIKVKCRKCGKRLLRVLSSEQSINPYNRFPNGRVKTEADIRRECDADVSKQVKEVESAGLLCKECQDAPNLPATE